MLKEEITSIRDVDVEGRPTYTDDNLVKGTVTIGNVQGGIEIKGGNSYLFVQFHSKVLLVHLNIK